MGSTGGMGVAGSGKRRRDGAGTRRRARHDRSGAAAEAMERRLLLAADVTDFTQGANGDAVHAPPLGDITWINGILNPNNSEYFEGVSTLQRIFFDGIDPTGSNAHTLTFSHQAAKSTAHAYDFLTSWDQALAATNAIAPGTLTDPHLDSGDAGTLQEVFEPGSSSPGNFTAAAQALHAAGNVANVSIPDNLGTLLGDDVAARIAAYEGFFGNRTLRIYGNAPISAASMVFDGYSGSGPQADYTLSWTSASTQIFIEFAGHLAQGEDFTLAGLGYGAGKGAGSISGGPYHIFLNQLDGASLGQQDNQIQANAVSAPPNFTIDKTGDVLGKVGDGADYTVTIHNNGALPLHPQSITDSLQGTLAASAFTESGANDDVLEPGETWTLNYSRVVLSTDPDPLTNTVTAVFDTQSNLAGIELTRADNHTVELFQPSVHVVKSGDTLSKIGDPVDYTFTITNTSSADSPDLVNASAVDSLLGNLLSGSNPFVLTSNADGAMSPGEVWTITARRTVQAGDPDPLPNTVAVSFNPQGFPNVISPGANSVLSHSVNLFQPSIDVEKTGDALGKVGDPADYTVTVTNTSSGDSPDLVNVTLVDTLLGDLLDAANVFVTSSNADGAMSPGEVWTITARRTVQAGDPDPLPNTVVVHANPSGFPNDITDNDSHTVNLFQPGIDVEKTGDTLGKVTDPADYRFVVTNTSSNDSPDLVNVTLVDTLLGDLLDPANPYVVSSDADGALSPGEVWTIAARRVVQAGDADPLPNTVTVHANPSNFPNDITDSDSHEVELFQPSYTVVKSGDTLGKVTDPVDYRFVVTNTSSSDSPDLVSPVLTDSLLGNLLDAANPFVVSSNADGALSVGEVWTINARRVVQAGDADPLPNTVTSSFVVAAVPAAGFDGGNVITPGAGSVLSHSVDLFQPSILVTKDGDTLGKVGDPVDYIIRVSNTGSAASPDLVNVTVVDTLLGDLLDPTNPFLVSSDADGALSLGETWTITARRAVQTGDADPLPNTVTATGVVAAVPSAGFDGGNVLADSDDHTVQLFQPSYTVVKSGDTLGKVTDPVDYTFVVTNTSSSDSPDLVSPVLTDSLLGNLLDPANAFVVSSNADGVLSPGEVWTISARRVVQAGDADPLPNTVAASFTVPAVPAAGFDGGNVVAPGPGSVLSHTVELFQPNFSITKVALDADGTVVVGDTVTYRITITNTSSPDGTALVPVSIIDTKIGALAASAFVESGTNDDMLALGETWTGDFTYDIQAADLPSFTNVVTATFDVPAVPAAGFDGGNRLVRSASETLQVENPPRGSVLPTGVDCEQFVDFAIDGTRSFDSLIGQLADGFNLALSGGKISNVADPGAAFYFTTFTAPADGDSSAFTVKIQQTSTGGNNYLLGLTQVQVHRVVGTAPNASCETVFSNRAFGIVSDGIQFTLPDSLEGVPLVCRIRIDPKAIVGKTAPTEDLTNHFKTFVNGVFADEDPDGVLLNIPPYGLSSASTSAIFSATRIRLQQREDLRASALLA